MLNEVVSEKHITDPGVVLSQLHLGFRSALKQEIGETDTYNGMDAGLCLMDLRNDKIVFAGARRPLFYIKDSELIEIKGNRKSIGGRQREQKRIFNSHRIDLAAGQQKEIMLYLTTDGFADQHNAQNKKYGSRRLKKFLRDHAHLSTVRQKEMLLEELKKYRGSEEQRDDITIIGIRLRIPEPSYGREKKNERR